MANTKLLKILAESYVRAWLTHKYGIEFERHEKEMKFIAGGCHRFDVVSKDRSIVAGIKTSSLKNNRKVGAGVIKSTFAELYFLSLIKANKKLMVLTDKGYYEHFSRISKGKITQGIEIIHCPLSEDIKKKIAIVHETCRKEIGKR